MMVAEGGIEPPSPDYRSGAAAIELLRENLQKTLVDPAGLKPAPDGLKVRCTVARAPGQQELAVVEGVEPSIVAVTMRCLTNLATPQ